MYSVFYNYIFVVCTFIPIIWAVAKFWNGWNPYQIPTNASSFTGGIHHRGNFKPETFFL